MTIPAECIAPGYSDISLKVPGRTFAPNANEMKSFEGTSEYLAVHDKHVRSKKYDCNWCHDFSRPERGLKLTPILTKLSDVINILKILAGQAPAGTLAIQDQNGDGRIGLAEAINSLRVAVGL